MTDLPAQEVLIAALLHPDCYPHQAKSVRLIETHISWVLLAGRYAYKIKKAVDLGFLDFTSQDARDSYCHEEIRLNQRLAPKIYLEAIPIGGSYQHPELGQLPAIEYAVKMRRFASGKLLNRLLKQGKLAPSHMDSLAAQIARFHLGLHAATEPSFGSATTIHSAATQNFDQLKSLLHAESERKLLAAIAQSTADEFSRCETSFEQRHAHGWIRECHGDLHLGNIVLIGDTPMPFDGIEFNPALRWIDVMDETSFLIMDLLHQKQHALAFRFLNTYLEATGDYAGIAVLRFYIAYRSMVRAKVSAIRASQPGQTKRARNVEMADCHGYLDFSAQVLQQRSPALIITHGLPGSGKTTFSQHALEQFGAIRLRSDVERKRLYKLSSLDNSRSQRGTSIYSEEATQRTYARLLELARLILGAGFPVIVDAAFLRQDERMQFRRLAQGMGIPFAIASISAHQTTLHSRIAHRQANGRDASEANTDVLQFLSEVQEPLSSDERTSTVEFSNDEPDTDFGNQQGWLQLQQLTGLS